MRRTLTLLACFLLVAACGGDPESVDSTTSSSTTSSSTTTEAATTATSETTATTLAPTTTTTSPPAAPVASGSGCTPSGDVLPDGDWFGFMEGVDTTITPASLVLDLACYFDGPNADLAAAADGRPTPVESPPYVRNQNPKIFALNLDAAATVDSFMGGSFTAWFTALPADNGCSAASGFSACPLWVHIQGGFVTMVYGVLPEWSGDGRGS
jgi:hypothetical protein